MISYDLNFIMGLLDRYYNAAAQYTYDVIHNANKLNLLDSNVNYAETPDGVMQYTAALFHKEVKNPEHKEAFITYYHNGAFRIVGGSMTEEDFWKSLT